METIAKTVAGNLRDLVIASLQQVTDAALEHFVSHCSNVRTLQLAGSHLILPANNMALTKALTIRHVIGKSELKAYTSNQAIFPKFG